MAVLTMFIKNINTFNSNSKFLLILTLITFSTFYYSCSKGKTSTPDAINKLIYDLKSQNPDCSCNPFMDEYLWENKTVYVSSCGGPACDCIAIFYDSTAQKFNLDSSSYQQFFQQSTFKKNVWTCK
jgi:hypothetical protein